MTQSPKLTPKEWTILKLFIVREGFALESVKHNPRRKQKGVAPRDLAPDHFYSYPDDIVAHLTTKKYVDREEKGSNYSDFHKGFVKDVSAVTIPTAGKACRKFVGLGIFERVERRRTEKKFQETTQYFLKSDFETFKTVLFFLMQNCDVYERVEMLSRPFFNKIITEDLVRMRLFEKEVSIINNLDIFDWAPNEIPRVLEILDEKKEGVFADFEKETLEDIRQKEINSTFLNQEASDWVFAPYAQYALPILPEGIPVNEKRLVIEKNISPGTPDHTAVTKYPSVLENQFTTIQREQLILPILALVQSSPMVLAEFFLGTWETFNLPNGLFHWKNESFTNPFFMRFVSLAISDMANTLKIPGNRYVDSFELREFSKQLTLDGEYRKEDGILRIGLTRGYDIYYDMGYSTRDRKHPPSLFPTIEEKKPSPNKFWVKIRVRQVSPFFIRKTEVKDVALLLTLLKANNQLSDHIRGILSNRMQNLILRYENNEPSIAFTKFLIEEINRALLREDFFNPKAFSEIKISKKTKDGIDGYSHIIETDDGSTGSDYQILLMRNRYLLDDSFSEAIARFGDVQYPIRKEPVETSQTQNKK